MSTGSATSNAPSGRHSLAGASDSPAGSRPEAQAYYRIADLPPPYRVQVWLYHEGREFIGVRVRDQSTGREHWAEWRGGKAFPLDAAFARHLPSVGLWRPQHPDKWELRLPEPVTLSEAGRLMAERQRFTALDEIEAADLAREMEADRSHAKRGGRLAERESPRSTLWWLNPAAITYSPSGRITAREAEGRLMRALCPEQFAASAAGLGMGMVLMAFMDEEQVRALAEHQAKYPPSLPEPFKPLPADLKDSETALGWFRAYCAAKRGGHKGPLVLRHRSRDVGLSNAAIGRLFALTHTKAITGQAVGQIFDQAMAEITDIANGKPHPGVAVLAERMADLRVRNRKAKMGERA